MAIAKTFKRIRGKAIKRYFKKGYKPKVRRIMKDVATLKKMVNAEKKYFSITATAAKVGQCSVNTNGYYVADITPTPAQGTTDITRTGDSIKICSCYIKGQVYQQSNILSNIWLNIYIIKVLGAPQTVSTSIQNFFEVSPWSGLIDYNSQTNPDYFGQFKIVKRKRMRVDLTNYSSATTIKTFQIPLRMQHHVRFSANSTTVSNGQLILFITADSGNTSTTASTLTNIPVTAGSSGLNLNYDMNWYYYDN